MIETMSKILYLPRGQKTPVNVVLALVRALLAALAFALFMLLLSAAGGR